MTSPPTRSDLSQYVQPSVAVDVALLTVVPGDAPHLGVVLVRRGPDRDGPGWCLPGTFMHEGERLADAVRRVLREKAGLSGVEPRQLHVFDDPARDPRGWVLSVAHLDTLRADALDERTATEHEVTVGRVVRDGASVRADLPDGQRALPYDHAAILERAADDLRRRYLGAPDPAGLLAEPFTLRQLLLVHAAVEGREPQKDTFRRRVEPDVVATGQVSRGATGRPAELFRRRPESR